MHDMSVSSQSMDILEETLIEEIRKISQNVAEELFNDKKAGFDLSETKIKNVFGPLYSDEALTELKRISINTLEKMKIDHPEIRKWSFVEDDHFVCNRLIPTLVVESIERTLKCKKNEAIEYFKRGPFIQN